MGNNNRAILGLIAGVALSVGTSAYSQSADEKTVKRDDVKTWVITVDGKDYEAHPQTPAYDGSTGLFHLPTAYTLPKGKVSVSLFRDNLDRDPKDEDISVHGVNLAIGVTSRLELAAVFGLQNRVNVDAPTQPGFVNDYPYALQSWETGAGDLKLSAKFKALDDYSGDALGLAFRGYVKFPTADAEDGLGTGKKSFGLDMLLSKSLGRAADIHGAIGYQWNSDPDAPTPVDIANAFKWGLGINFPACKKFQIQAEVTGTKYHDADFVQTNPIDLVVGPVFWFGKGIFIRPAISKNLKFDDRGLNSGFRSSTGMQLAVGYHPGTKCCAIEVPAPPPPPPPVRAPEPQANRNPTVTCEAERSSVAAGDVIGLRAIASDPDNDSLTYAWTTPTGRISGTGSSVRLDTTGVGAPASINANVRVTDGKGGSAEATCNVRIPAPERKPEAATCASSGFPRNLSRLNNVDKSCLDDVAIRLRQDPRSRVVIVGHADRDERFPEILSRKRAEETKAYLVKERGVEESRITTQGAGASRAGDQSAATGNRRVEVTFVPEGATFQSR